MYRKYIKRIIDILISFLGFPFFLLLYIPISILIKLEDGGPVFYNAMRLGQHGVPFRMFKFRTMKVNSPDIRLADGSTYNAADDPRVTKIGRFLRELSLDETPQIVNILFGKMSLIGPRPDINLNDKFIKEIQQTRKVKPGITGYSQAYFRNETNWSEKIKNDLYYVENISFRMDLRIFLRTVYMVLRREKMYRKETNC
jgi:undecaprenyl phosphate N,N'-diacetylbacillosamine 1-phosphate transferase